MKRAFAIVTAVLLLFSAAAILSDRFAPLNTASLKFIREVDSAFIENLKSARKPAGNHGISAFYHGNPLPRLGERLFFQRRLAEDVTVRTGGGFQLVKRQAEGCIELLAYNNTYYTDMIIETTPFPLISVETTRTPDDKFRRAAFTVFEPAQTTAYAAEIKVRGSSSSIYAKKSYTLKLRNPKAQKIPASASILGLRENTKFALNSMYEDDSKIRDILSADLWQSFGAGNNPQHTENALHFLYTEMVLDGAYQGLYGFQEVVDEYSLQVKPYEKAAIFKVNGTEYATPPDGYISPALSSYKAVEVVYDTLPANTRWNRFIEMYSALEAGNGERDIFTAYLDIENCTDYLLLFAVTRAKGNSWKNMVFTQRETGGLYKFVITPYDWDISFGGIWDRDAKRGVRFVPAFPEYSFSAEVSYLVFPDALWQLNADDFRRRTAQRYFALRKDIFSADRLIRLADSYYDTITESGARRRDAERWPDSAIAEDNHFIREFIPAHLAVLDGFFGAVDK